MHNLILLLLLCGAGAEAAKVSVSWTNPTLNTDGSELTNLAFVRIEWGSCVGNLFGEIQAGIVIPTTQTGLVMRGFIYPSNLMRVCVRAYAINSYGVSSVPSNVAFKNLLPTPGRPVTLGQPVIF